MKSFTLSYHKKTFAKIHITYSIAVIFVATLFYNLVPNLLNYAPGYAHIDEISGLNYTWQFVIMVIIAIAVGGVILFFCLKGIDKIERYMNDPKEVDHEKLLKMKRRLVNLPYLIYLIQIVVPVFMLTAMSLPLFILENADLNVFFRVIILVVTFFVLVSIITLIVSQRVFKKMLLQFESDKDIGGLRIPVITKFYIQILPMFIIALLFSSLIGYSNNVREKGNLVCEEYIASLKDAFVPYADKQMNVEQIKQVLYNVRTVHNLNDIRYIIAPDKSITTSDGKKLGEYYVTYLYELSLKNGGYVYDVTEEIRGVIIKVSGVDGEYLVGIKSVISSPNLVLYYVGSFIFVLLLCSLVLYFLSKAMSEDILSVAHSMCKIASGEYARHDKKLSISSNDEISDLISAYNRIQELVQTNIKQIRENQDVLIQNERLASLGQLIGGIAHSFKTPIATASDTALCLETLVDEYDKSIDLDTVTNADHHHIASDMKVQINDMKETLEYINSIIITVKNYSSDLERANEDKFSLKDLIASIKILMSNELKKNSCKLNIHTDIPEESVMSGDMKVLIQVINVLLSNAIQAYQQGNGVIDLSIMQSGNDIEVVVQDYGTGISKEIQQKILNKMVTTKGNKGTGIGLYISNSIIKAKFSGQLKFESEPGKGTTFRIILPIKKKGDKA